MEDQSSFDYLKKDELEARQIQLSLLPEAPMAFSDCHFDYVSQSSGYLSGDILDYFEIVPGKVLFYLADVSGHGAAPALITVLIKNLVHQFYHEVNNGHIEDLNSLPARILSTLNADLHGLQLSRQAAMFCGLLDLQTKSLYYSAVAMMPKPFVLRKGTEPGKVLELEGKGLPLGLNKRQDFAVHQFDLQTNDTLWLLTDGIFDLLKPKSISLKSQDLLALLDEADHTLKGLLGLLPPLEMFQYEDDLSIMRVGVD